MTKRTFAIALSGLLMAACGKDVIEMKDITYFDAVDNVSFDRTVTVALSDGGSTVNYSSDDFSYSVSGGKVTIVNNSTERIRYEVSGSTTNGQLKIYSSAVQALSLNSVNIANGSGAAINLQGATDDLSKAQRTYIVMTGSSTISDGSTYSDTDGEDQKAALFSEGILAFSGSGSLTVNASGRSGVVSDDYIHMTGGTLTVNCSSSASVSGGDTLKPAGIKAKDAFVVSGGTLIVSSTGTGCKGISGSGTAMFRGGTVSVTTTGSNYGSSKGGPGDDNGHGPGNNEQSSSGVSAKGIRFDGDIAVSGGSLTVKCTSHEGIESKSKITVSGGAVYSYSAADDAINSGGDMTISGGYVCAYATSNDGLDANGDCYIKGGVVYAIGASSPEVAVDANTEENYTLYVQGGTLIAVGGLESGAELDQSCYSAGSWSSNTWYALTADGANYLFKTPSSGGSGLVISASSSPSLKSGVSASGGTEYADGMLIVGGSYSGGSTVSLSSYTGGNNNGGGHR